MEERRNLFSYVEGEPAIPRARLFTRIEEKGKKPGIVERVEELEPCNFSIGGFVSDSAERVNVSIPQPLAQTEIFSIEQVTSNIPKVLETIRQTPERREKINIDAASFSYFDGTLSATDGKVVEPVGNFALQIVEEKREVQEIVNEANERIGTKAEEKWKIKINVSDKTIYEGTVKGDRLFDFDWIGRISENRAALSSSPNAKKLLKKYLQNLLQAERHPAVVEYASSGWKWLENGQVFYLTSQGAIGMNHLRIKAAKGFELLTKPADQRQILQEFLGMRTIIPGNPGNAVFLQSYTIAALLTALFKKSGHQLEFSTALIGKTNTKKTSCGEIFTRVFNRTPSAVPEINFSATEAAIYEIMDKNSDTIVMIDDLSPAENDIDAREKRRKLENIIRAYGDRVPRRRSVAFASNSTVKEFTSINGCALITGETFSGGKSSRSRVVVLNFEEGDVNNSALSYYQANLHTLPNFVNDFLQYVTGRIEQVMQIIELECAQARQNVKKKLKFQDSLMPMGFYALRQAFLQDTYWKMA